MYEFLVQYWPFISTGLVILITVIFAFVRKRPITEIIDDSAYQTIIQLVKEAESLYGSKKGKEKMKFVQDHYHQLLYGNASSIVTSVCDDAVASIVEDVLGTPERREKK